MVTLVPVQESLNMVVKGFWLFGSPKWNISLHTAACDRLKWRYHPLLNWEQANFWQTENIIIQHTNCRSADTGTVRYGMAKADWQGACKGSPRPSVFLPVLTQGSAWFEGSQSRALPCASVINSPYFPSAQHSQEEP